MYLILMFLQFLCLLLKPEKLSANGHKKYWSKIVGTISAISSFFFDQKKLTNIVMDMSNVSMLGGIRKILGDM